MAKLKTDILFIGGCLLNQTSLRREELFHAILRGRLQEIGEERDFHFHFCNYWAYSSLAGLAEKAVTRRSIDLAVVFIRPYPMMALLKPLIKYGANRGKKHLAIHPALLRWNGEWNAKLDPPTPRPTDVRSRRNKFALRDLNLAAGKLLGLEKWAQHYIKDILTATKEMCGSANTQLLVVSPPDNPESFFGSIVCRNTTAMLRDFCKSEQIEFVTICEKDLTIFESDRVHFNSSGHRFLADRLAIAISRCVPEQKKSGTLIADIE